MNHQTKKNMHEKEIIIIASCHNIDSIEKQVIPISNFLLLKKNNYLPIDVKV